MRIESPRYIERFGAVRINDAQQVLELDSGRAKELPFQENIAGYFTGKTSAGELAEEIDSFSAWIVAFLEGFKNALLAEDQRSTREELN